MWRFRSRCCRSHFTAVLLQAQFVAQRPQRMVLSNELHVCCRCTSATVAAAVSPLLRRPRALCDTTMCAGEPFTCSLSNVTYSSKVPCARRARSSQASACPLHSCAPGGERSSKHVPPPRYRSRSVPPIDRWAARTPWPGKSPAIIATVLGGGRLLDQYQYRGGVI